jgi:hypothetical protein
MGRKRRGIRAAFGRRLVRAERWLIRTAMVPMIAVADRRISRSMTRNA